MTGGLKEAGDDEDDGREGRGGEEVVLRDELWARDRGGRWVRLEQAIG